ncbi:hypothetical protein DL96DRAFT_1645371 [Flagelloscypha sp. PMI_526]|nr:hypothetical protein DL96DRAFT_1645371 [Flagelloscypha sp. PMI_526]
MTKLFASGMLLLVDPLEIPFKVTAGQFALLSFLLMGFKSLAGLMTRLFASGILRQLVSRRKLYRMQHFHLPLMYFLLDDGWVVDEDNCRIVWIPHHLREFLPTPDLVDILGSHGMIVVDLSYMRIGPQWASCIEVFRL